MFARNVSFHLKSNMLSDYTRTFEKDVLPLLRKQNGFRTLRPQRHRTANQESD